MVRLNKAKEAISLLIFSFLLFNNLFATEFGIYQIITRNYPNLSLHTYLPSTEMNTLHKDINNQIRIFEDNRILLIDSISLGTSFSKFPDLLFLIDLSHSMNGKKLKIIKHCMKKLLSTLDSVNSIGVVTFTSQCNIIQCFTNNRDSINHTIKNLNTKQGKSAVYDGLIYSIGFLEKNGRIDKSIVILLSDGIDTGSKLSLKKVINYSTVKGTQIYALTYITQNSKFSLVPLDSLKQIYIPIKYSFQNTLNSLNSLQVPKMYYKEICLYTKSLSHYKKLPISSTISITYKDNNYDTVYTVNKIHTRNNNFFENKVVIILLFSVCIIYLCIFVCIKKRKGRALSRHLKGLGDEITQSFHEALFQFVADLQPTPLPEISLDKIEQKLLSLHASNSFINNPWYMDIELNKDEAIFIAELLITSEKLTSKADFIPILNQLKMLAQSIDENGELDYKQLNEISHWKEWWGKVSIEHKKKKAIIQENKIKAQFQKRSNKIINTRKDQIKKRIDEITKKVSLKKDDKIDLIYESNNNEITSITGTILNRENNDIIFRCIEKVSVEDILFLESFVTLILEFSSFVNFEFLTYTDLIYQVIEVSKNNENGYDIIIQKIGIDDLWAKNKTYQIIKSIQNSNIQVLSYEHGYKA